MRVAGCGCGVAPEVGARDRALRLCACDAHVMVDVGGLHGPRTHVARVDRHRQHAGHPVRAPAVAEPAAAAAAASWGHTSARRAAPRRVRHLRHVCPSLAPSRALSRLSLARAGSRALSLARLFACVLVPRAYDAEAAPVRLRPLLQGAGPWHREGARQAGACGACGACTPRVGCCSRSQASRAAATTMMRLTHAMPHACRAKHLARAPRHRATRGEDTRCGV